MIDVIWQDVVIALGSMVGLVSKGYALFDTETEWSRWASLPNAILYIPSIIAFATLELWATMIICILNMFIWLGIGLYRPKTKQ
jgi:hypothetical protein